MGERGPTSRGYFDEVMEHLHILSDIIFLLGNFLALRDVLGLFEIEEDRFSGKIYVRRYCRDDERVLRAFLSYTDYIVFFSAVPRVRALPRYEEVNGRSVVMVAKKFEVEKRVMKEALRELSGYGIVNMRGGLVFFDKERYANIELWHRQKMLMVGFWSRVLGRRRLVFLENMDAVEVLRSILREVGELKEKFLEEVKSKGLEGKIEVPEEITYAESIERRGKKCFEVLGSILRDMADTPLEKYRRALLNASLHTFNERYDRALKILGEFVNEIGEDPFILLYMGTLQALMGKWKEAEDTLRRAVLRGEEFVLPYAFLALTLSRRGKKREAVGHLRKYCKNVMRRAEVPERRALECPILFRFADIVMTLLRKLEKEFPSLEDVRKANATLTSGLRC